MSRVLPLYTLEQLGLHNNSKDCWVSLYGRKIYDVTRFLNEHPGGDELILNYAGKDITEIMADEISHIHSESAYEILEDDYLVGFLATDEEAKELLSNKSHQVDVRMNHDGQLYDTTIFGEVPPENKLSIQTDYTHDFQKYKFLDLDKPLLMQVLTANWTKEFYLDQVHRPRHYGKGSAPLFGNFLEPLSLTPWYVVPLVWIPLNLYIFWKGFINLNPLIALFFWGLGLFVWTLIEYCLHRFLFHLDYYLPESQYAFAIHFLLHGVHHYLPMDQYRLVMPPTLFAVLCFPFYKLVFSIFPFYIACSAFSGGFLGYIIYDCTHYILHHAKLPKYFQELKTYHLEHHYKNYELGFGVTSKFWDEIFGTVLHKEDKRL
ncbi:hypothetical protein PACTADRAFT_76338 [Pachysolen tannophilus NRRL Y-2460]|uniref:Ceramide very long chain fatty acid hydroxylase n=1 Tax=Pachysolen tannophilus NRRL Y-2460 TaxID=669874 RepID=A0A1E4TSK1_PACTA|nr:hypothetical protein PACTADRAFT_76338 [Pachysolen tannophilus NRRL Y-2460]